MKKRIILPALVACITLITSCTTAGTKDAAEPAVASTTKKTTSTPKKAKSKPTAARTKEKAPKRSGLSGRAESIKDYAAANGYSTKYSFLIDMSLPGGKKRFYVYDLENGSLAYSGLVAHGSCNEGYISHPRFSNASESGCSSLGKYKVGGFYHGKYGASFKLYGLERSNSNAYQRGVVIHAHECVPDDEIYPRAMCNSFGCPMVSFNFFARLSSIINSSDKPIVLWIYR